MIVSDVKDLVIDYVADDELPHRVELTGNGHSVEGAGVSLGSALLTAFSVSGMFPSHQFPYRDQADLAAFIFWNFKAGDTWLLAIKALEVE